MKRIFFILSMLVLTSWINVSFANDSFSSDRWSISGEYLYLKPMVDDTYFVVESPLSTAFPNGERKNNDPGFHSGFRVGLGYSFCDCDADFKVRYSRVTGTDDESVSGSFLWATIGRPDLDGAFENYTGTASSSIKSSYDRVDAYFAQKGWRCGCLDFNFLLGIEYAHLKLTEDVEYQILNGALGTAHQKSKTWGVGPQIGVLVDYPLYTCDSGCLPGELSLGFETSASLLASKSQNEGNNILGAATLLDYHDEHTVRMIPAIHTLLGLKYQTHFSCYKAALCIGYEFSSYIRGIHKANFDDDVGDGHVFTHYQNFDLQGLHVGLEVRF